MNSTHLNPSPTVKPVALVTGGTRGIGAAISQQLAQDGFHVVMNFHSNQTKANETLETLQSQGLSASLSAFDVSQSAQIDTAVADIIQNYGEISVLVNNAGISIDSLLLRLKDEDLLKILQTDLASALYCSRSVMRSMMKKKSGSIINISSVVGEMGNAGQTAYAASKAGMIGFTKSLAKEVASRKIRVNAVTPGYIDTEMTSILTDDQKEAILTNVPLNTLGTPQDVAHLVSFLASSRSNYITGQVIGINGGLYM